MNSQSSSLQRSRTAFDSVLLRNRDHVRLQHFVVAVMFVIFLVMTPMFVHGQAISGNLTGTVADPSGAVVNGAKVEATNVATGQTLSTTGAIITFAP